jgi:plastocyanin
MIGLLLLTFPATVAAGTIQGKVYSKSLRDDANIVVYIAQFLDQPNVKFKPPAEDAVVEQNQLLFMPHVLPVLRGTRVAFVNDDEVGHNVMSPSKTKRFNLGTYPQGGVRHVVFDQPGVVALLCTHHQEMSAYIIVTETPFFAVTDKEGHFEIEDVPAGRYILKTWHEKLKPTSREITVGSSLTIEIKLEN